MDIGFQVLILFVSIYFLLKGADFFVEGSANIALNFGVSPLFIGLTLVAFGTSAPEAAVSIHASINNANEISLGNILGSNIANIGLVLGITSLFSPVAVSISTLKRELPMTLIATLLLGGMMFLGHSQSADTYILSRFEGVVLLILFILFLIYTIDMAKKDRAIAKNKNMLLSDIKIDQNIIKNIMMVAGGLVAIILAGKYVVESSINIARYFHVSERFIAVTIVALGTSLPELVTSIIAIIKKEHGIALGNIIGSCLFNILFVLGMAVSIHPIFVDPAFMVDLTISFLLVFLVLVFAINWKKSATDKKESVNRITVIEGWLFLLIYCGYIAYVIVRL